MLYVTLGLYIQNLDYYWIYRCVHDFVAQVNKLITNIDKQSDNYRIHIISNTLDWCLQSSVSWSSFPLGSSSSVQLNHMPTHTRSITMKLDGSNTLILLTRGLKQLSLRGRVGLSHLSPLRAKIEYL